MHHARSFLTVLFLVGSLAGATRAIAAEDTSPPSVTSHEVNVLRQVAIALAAGDHAIQDLRGPPIENSNLDRLKLPTPGMDCGIARSLIFVVCRSTSLNKKEAEAMFARIIDYGQAALPSDSWRQFEAVPYTGLIRTISYQHWKSGAQIDVDLVVQPTGEAQPLYFVRVFGWARFLTASRTTKPELYRRNTNLSLATSVHSLYAAALAGAATKGNTGVERILG